MAHSLREQISGSFTQLSERVLPPDQSDILVPASPSDQDFVKSNPTALRLFTVLLCAILGQHSVSETGPMPNFNPMTFCGPMEMDLCDQIMTAFVHPDGPYKDRVNIVDAIRMIIYSVLGRHVTNEVFLTRLVFFFRHIHSIWFEDVQTVFNMLAEELASQQQQQQNQPVFGGLGESNRGSMLSNAGGDLNRGSTSSSAGAGGS